MPVTPENDAAAPRSGAPEGAETFDPARHLTARGAASEGPVYLELACSCGGIRKQYDPPSYLARTVEVWQAQHAGPGHGPASVAQAMQERESRREAAFRAAGRSAMYERVELPRGLSEEVTSWPDLSAAGGANTGSE